MAATLVAGCNQTTDQGCDRFADMETMCQASPEIRPRGRQLAILVCSEAQTTADDWLSELQARQVECAEQSPSCESYQYCKFQIALP